MELNRQQEIVVEIVMLCQILNYRLDELEPCAFEREAKILLKNIVAQSGRVDKVVNTLSSRLDGGEDHYQMVINGLDEYFKKLHKKL